MSLTAFYPPLALVAQALRAGRGRVFLVGGAVRNYLLKRPGRDLDFAVESNSTAIGRSLARKIKGAFVLLDRGHGSVRIVKTIDGAAWTFDLTDWRAKSIQGDLGLRDFTVNALAADISGPGKILAVQDSRRDLKSGTVRMVSFKAFQDDPVRLLRAYVFQAVLGFHIEAKTRRQIQKDAHLLAQAPAERIREELFKILASDNAAKALADMDRTGLLAYVLPQVTVMYGVHQGGYHHLDVWRHSLEVVRQLERTMAETGKDRRLKEYWEKVIGGGHTRRALLKLAALLHDVGKPETRRARPKRMTFHGHEIAGERISRQSARHLKLSTPERYFLENVVRLHLRPGYLANFKRPSEKAVFRYLRDAGEEAAALAVLALADQAATRGPLTTPARHQHHAKICRMLIRRYFEKKDLKPKPRLLSGHDLIKVLKLKPSPLFGKILSQVEEAAALGSITTKQEALALARTIQ